nr:segregation/condensation protein A [Gammaproteobacteria bacterium]
MTLEQQPISNNLPIATVLGKQWLEMPQDLYIPPDALEVFLEAFEGPLDFLLYLIKKQNLDILDIPIAKITAQYLEYIALMEGLRFELAAEYLVMAASLAEIKSRMLLPRPESVDEEVDDPRAELVRRLQEYERYKKAAENIDSLTRMERDTARACVELPEMSQTRPLPSVDLRELLVAFQEVLQRA